MSIRTGQTLRIFAVAVVVGIFASAACAAFPDKPIRIVVTAGAGGNIDALARLLGEQMSKTLGQPIIVENVPGAGGLIALRLVSKQVPADGYTLLAGSNTVVLAPAFTKNPGYDPVKDLVGIGDMQTLPYLLLGPTSGAQKTVAALIASAKAKPGSLTLANGGIGTSTHLPALMFAQQAGIDVVHVPYKGNAAALPDVLGGRADAFFDTAAVAKANEGKLRAYAVTSAKRMPQFPDVPTLAEQGLPNFNFIAYLGLFAPAATPPDVVKRLNEAMRAASRTEVLREYFERSGSQPGSRSSEEFTAFIKQDSIAAAKVVSDLGIEKE